MPNRLSSLTITKFRGSIQELKLDIDSKKPLILIFGENGTGKSTIVDSIEFAGAGTTSFTNDWKLGQGKRKESFIPSIDCGLDEVSVELLFGSKSFKAKLTKNGAELCPTTGRPAVKVLRRRSLQSFIDADPADRYKSIAKFLEIPGIEASENTLRQAQKNASELLTTAITLQQQAEENIEKLWLSEGSPGANDGLNAQAWAAQQAGESTTALESELNDANIYVENGDKLAILKKSVNEDKSTLNELSEELSQCRQELESAENNNNSASGDLVSLLKSTKSYLTKHDEEICPVCEETSITSESLIEKIELRITGMDAVRLAQEAVEKKAKEVDDSKRDLEKSEKAYLDHASATQVQVFPETDDTQKIKFLRTDYKTKALDEADNLFAQIKDQLELYRQNQIDLQKQLNNQNSIQQFTESLSSNTKKAERLDQLTKRLSKGLTVYEAQRKSYVEGVLEKIANDVDELYQSIHPGKGIGGIKLKLDKKKRGSLLYEVAFGSNTDVHPQPYYSESQLDTLGLCIFLALAKKDSKDTETLLVLDDVLGSVDQKHLEETIKLLVNQALHFSQLIITTHYRPLRDQFRFAKQASSTVHLLELKPWTSGIGVSVGSTKVYLDELKANLNKDGFSRDIVASQAGQLFESLLEFISKTYRCRVPHLSEPRYTFSDLANAPSKKLKKALTVKQHSDDSTVETKLEPIFSKLDEAIHIRNLVGCHFNELAGQLSDEEVRNMAHLAIEFSEALVCSSCGSLSTSEKSGSYWSCPCKSNEMHPLQEPK